MTRSIHTFFAPCPRGLEGVLRAEIEALGGQKIFSTQGGIGYTGPFDLCYRANLESRVASRILWRVGFGNYRSEHDLYQAASQLPWSEWFSVQETIKIKVSARHCALKSLDYVTLRIKDAVCDRFKAVSGRRPYVDTCTPGVRIVVYLDRQRFTFYIDTSGEPLFKRGLRRSKIGAPLRKNLAAGIIKLSGWQVDQPLFDPMCGGGTILMEAAQIAGHIAPGLHRSFAFERLYNFDSSRWKSLCEASRARQALEAPFAVYGCDRQEEAVQSARTNLKQAGLDHVVDVKQGDILKMTPPTAAGILITNPPYGVRMGHAQELAEFYPRMGDVLKQQFPGWRAYILSTDMRLPALIRLAASRRLPLFNGALECRLYEFVLVTGSMRRQNRRN